MALDPNLSALEAERDALQAKCNDLGTSLKLVEAQVVSLTKDKEMCLQSEGLLRTQVEHMATETSSMECDMAVLKGELDVLRQGFSLPTGSGLVAQTLGYCIHCGQRTMV